MFSQLVLFKTSGHLELNIGGDVDIKITLSETKCDTIRSMCERFYSERQLQIAQCVAQPVPQLAHFEEVV